jgi:dTDP-N-acetylfucosamine:lipid II N-acetylfucosaminyltransferase
MNIHLVNNYQFINNTINRFEQFYPGQNIFYLHEARYNAKKMNKRDKLVFTNLVDKKNINKLINDINDGDNLLLHHLSALKAALALKILKKRKVETYWIFYGGDLYGTLVKNNRIKLFDKDLSLILLLQEKIKNIILTAKLFMLSVYFNEWLFKAKEKFIGKLDYFCFWNKNDFLLLKKHYKTTAKYKYFRYYSQIPEDWQIQSQIKTPLILIVNHSASFSGNHLTILEHLKRIDSEQIIKKLIVPLSYGSNHVRKQVIKFGNDKLSYCFQPILNYLPPSDYFKDIGQASVAIWGHKRQEGGANLFFLLANGVKLFLRRDNNLLKYFKEKGFIIYEFENDLNSVDDLAPLDIEIQAHNKKLILDEFTDKHIEETYKNLIQ